MKIYKDIEQRTDEWHELRKGKITGTVLKKIVSGPKNRENAMYELLAERLSTATAAEAEENAMSRGVRLEDEAIAAFEKKTGIIVERAGFVESSFSKWVGYSPDGLIRKGKKYPEDIEVKCLSSGNHVRAWFTGTIPEEYVPQIVQGFIANEGLKIRHVVFYDPRIEVKPLVIVKATREAFKKQIGEYKKAECDFLKELDKMSERAIRL